MKRGYSFFWTYLSIFVFIPLYYFVAAKPLKELLGLHQPSYSGENELGLSSDCIINTHFFVLLAFTLAMTIWSIFLSKECITKKGKVLYCLSVFVFNAAVSVLFLMLLPRPM